MSLEFDAEDDELEQAAADDRPHTMQQVAAGLTGVVGLALVDHLSRAYTLGAQRAGVADPRPIELLGMQKRIEEQRQYLESSFGADLIRALEDAEDADAIDLVFANLEARAELYAGAAWVMYQAAYKDFGQPAQLVDFAGEDDARTCAGCDGAVQGNPYPLAGAPEPGAFECMSHCRHELIPLEHGEL